MSKVQLAVGQVWKDRGGRIVTIEAKARSGEGFATTVEDGRSHVYENGFYWRDGRDSQYDLIELVQDENGWRPWKATADSQCPVDGGTWVRYRLSNGKEHVYPAGGISWNGVDHPPYIVAYKIVEEAPKPVEEASKPVEEASKPVEEVPKPAATSPDADGWIPWVATADSQCPVDKDERVQLRWSDGEENRWRAGSARWNTYQDLPYILAYKSVERIEGEPDFHVVKPPYPRPSETAATQPPARRHAHYFKDVSQIDEIDVYRVCDLFEVDDPSGATQHAVKKLLCAGRRGAKDRKKDYQEAIDTLTRRLAMWEGE